METTIPLQIGQEPPQNDPKIFGALLPIYNSLWLLAQSIDQYTGQLDSPSDVWSELGSLRIYSQNLGRFYAIASTGINYGAMVNFFSSAGTLKARYAKADSINTPCMGYCVTAGGVISGAVGEFILVQGLLSGFSGLTVGAKYYLSPSSSTGQITATAPTTSGQIVQYVGWAISTTQLMLHPDLPYTLIP